MLIPFRIFTASLFERPTKREQKQVMRAAKLAAAKAVAAFAVLETKSSPAQNKSISSKES